MLRTHTGEALVLDRARWHAPATAEERALLSTVSGPAIDLGCGPGRVVVSLADEGVAALGVDSSPSAVALARRRGATVLEGDVFGPLPDEGRWATCLLFDGTIGIGGNPTRLLARCRELTGPEGRVIAEVEPPGTGWRHLTAWFELDGTAQPCLRLGGRGCRRHRRRGPPRGLRSHQPGPDAVRPMVRRPPRDHTSHPRPREPPRPVHATL